MHDPFDTLGIEPRYDLDVRAAEARHLELSRALHPDRYAGAPAAERRLALSKAIEVNEAWRVVRDPIRRAEAMLARAGVPHGEAGEPKPSPSLLMEMMEAREELATAKRARDLGRVTAMARDVSARERRCVAALGEAFARGGGAPEVARAALPVVGELRYLKRLADELAAVEEELAG